VLRFGLLIIAGLLFFATPALAQSSQTVTVVRVVDGDTIEVNPPLSWTEDVRLLGVELRGVASICGATSLSDVFILAYCLPYVYCFTTVCML
jgi:endonuclease YncB( thermonuclease family)